MTLEEAQAVATIFSRTSIPFVATEMMAAFLLRFPQFEATWEIAGFIVRLREPV